MGFVVGNYHSTLPRFPDLVRVPMSFGAVCLEYGEFVFVFFGGEAEVAAICEFGYDFEGELFASSADPDGGVGFLVGFLKQERVVKQSKAEHSLGMACKKKANYGRLYY